MLVKTNLSTEKLETISKTFPDISSLVLRGSVITPSLLFENSFKNVVKLNLAGCKIRNFSDLNGLGSYSSLTDLKLCSNPIDKIQYSGGFESLKKLNLEGTLINELVSVYNLNLFPVLTELRIAETPLVGRLKDHSRKILVCYFSKATKINGGLVDAKERSLHERQFIRDFSDPKNSREHVTKDEYISKLLGFSLESYEIETNQMIFNMLFNIHGIVQKFAEVNLAPPTSALLIFETDDGRKESKEVPLN